MGLLNIHKRADFVNLHGHSEMSTLDGVAQIKDIVEVTARKNMKAVAITDHGNLAAALPFFFEAEEHGGVKPIIGCEVYVAKNREERVRGYNHLLLLAKNIQGYQNLCKITSEAYINGFYYRPRTTIELIIESSEGLICSSACLGGDISQALLNNDYPLAKKLAQRYRDIFGGNFYLEVQFSAQEEQQKANQGLLKLSKALSIPLIATSDYHYTEEEDISLQDIALGVSSSSEGFFHVRDLYLKDGTEMLNVAKLVGGIPVEDARKAILRTMEVAEKCNIQEGMREFLQKRRFPSFNTDGESKVTFLKKLCKKGFTSRTRGFSKSQKDLYLSRMRYEFDVIIQSGFEDYFLVIQDIVCWARKNDIFVGVGRGSAAGCLVSWVLGITGIDPIKHDLMFERFLSPSRISSDCDLPDIDLDFTSARRDEVIQYLRDTYGDANVANIITHAKFGGKGVLRDLGRHFKIPQFLIDKISNQLPDVDPSIADLAEEMGEEKLLIQLKPLVKGRKYNNKPLEPEQLLKFAKKLEKQTKNFGTHAAGIVVSSEPLVNILPLQVNKGVVVTSFDETPRFTCISKLGLIKIDILGLKTLDIVKAAVDLIDKKYLPNGIWDLPLDDEKTLAAAKAGKTVGTFQFDADGIQKTLRTIEADCFDDLIAANALHRPGPLKSKGVEHFAKNKLKIAIDDENAIFSPEARKMLDPILSKTYGTIVFQEDVLRIAQTIAGFTPGDADKLRKAIAKKIPGAMEEMETKFVSGAISNGMADSDANTLWNQVEHHGGYSFNKSHAAAYSYLFYVTLYLKVHFPAEYMNAVLLWSTLDQRLRFIREAERLGVKVYPPDINKSAEEFAVVDNCIVYGLSKIKYVKSAAVKLKANGPYNSFEGFLKKNKPGRNIVGALIDSGALDGFGKRHELKREYNAIMVRYSYSEVDSRAQAQFDKRASTGKVYKVQKTLEDIKEEYRKKLLPERELSKVGLVLAEKLALGYYRHHPLSLKKLQPWLRKQGCASKKNLDDYEYMEPIIVCGVVEGKIKKFGINSLTISDPTGELRITFSEEFWDENRIDLELDSIGIGDIILASGIRSGAGIKMRTKSEHLQSASRRWGRASRGAVYEIYEITKELSAELSK